MKFTTISFFILLTVAPAMAQEYWGAFVLSDTWVVREARELNFGIAWNYPSARAALKAATDACRKRVRRGDCGPHGVYSRSVYGKSSAHVTKVAFSTSSHRNDAASLYGSDFDFGSVLATGINSDHEGKLFYLRQKCALVWSELGVSQEPNAPVVVFAETEEKTRAIFVRHWSRNANVSREWRNELKNYCNHN